MKKSILALFVMFIGLSSFGQNECFIRLQKAFDDRGSFTPSDDMHRNVIVSYFQDGGGSYCLSGKVRVENGLISSIFLQYEDDTYELLRDFYNYKKSPPKIVNGITEMIFNADDEKFKIVFIDQLKPKKKSYKLVALPDDL
ncbi:MAG: hypothetical protein QNK85_02160 [Crocinitomicaceae bacterium]